MSTSRIKDWTSKRAHFRLVTQSILWRDFVTIRVQGMHKASAKRSQHSAQHIPTLLGATCSARLATLLRHVACCWLKFEAGQIWAYNTQHVATHRNTVAKRTQHVALNNVAICCVGMLRLLGRGLRPRKTGVPTRAPKPKKNELAGWSNAVQWGVVGKGTLSPA